MMEKSIKITGLTKTRAMLKGVSDFLSSKKPMQGFVDDIKEDILTKTAKGLDYRGKRFHPYSKKYAKKKGVSKNDVDLRVSGRMLDSIDAEAITAGHGRVEVTDHELIAQYHNQGGPKKGKPPKRELMNVTDNRLEVLAKKWWDDPLMEIMGRR